MLFRIRGSDWFVGPRQIFLDTENTFKLSDYLPVPGVPDIKFDSRSSGIGVEALYDSLNNMLSPSEGIKGQLQATWYDPAWGSDTNFTKYRANFNGYRRVHPRLVLGLRADFSADSDVDVLVEFEADSKVGFSYFSLQDELSDLFGRQVDLSTPGFLSPQIRDRVVGEAQPVYEAA